MSPDKNLWPTIWDDYKYIYGDDIIPEELMDSDGKYIGDNET